jgi:LuxR family quorum sensing-dependent transcriptional regulator
MTYKILETVEKLQQAQTVNEVLDVMEGSSVLQAVNADMFCLILLPRPDQNFKEVSLAVRVPPEWQELYASEGFCHTDPCLRHCHHVVEPFEWQRAPFNPEKEPGCVEVVNRAHDFNVANGIVVPIPGPTGCIGGVWIGGHNTTEFAIYKPIVHLIALYAFHRVQQLIQLTTVTAKLSNREREVLT